MTKELFLRLVMFISAIVAIIFGVLSIGFDLTIPGAMFFAVATAFLCFGLLTLFEKDRSQLKHWKVLSITAFSLTLITSVLAIIEIVLM
ncbi:MAG: hypothetical protein DBX47_04775 [Clostridiales bacterium]|nr:MAG: hypothetical protein DBX47_04775 [Clostridiales bacterium]